MQGGRGGGASGAAIPFLPELRKPLLRWLAGILPLAVLVGLVFLPVHLLYKVLPLIVVACTMCCIRYGAAGHAGRILACPFLCKAGRVSFSLYLVHYPLISCYKSLPAYEGSAGVAVLLVCITVAAWLFYRLVEKRAFPARAGWPLWGVAALAAYGATFSPNAFLWRESDVRPYEAGDWYRPVDAAMLQGFRAEEFTPIHYVERMMDAPKEGDAPLLRLGGGEPAMEEALRGFVSALQGMGKKVVLVSHFPHVESRDVIRDHRLLTQRGGGDTCREGLTCTWAAYREMMDGCNAMLDKLGAEGLCKVLHIERPLFPGGAALHAVEDGAVIMHDNNHLAPPHGAVKALQGCEADLAEWLQQETP